MHSYCSRKVLNLAFHYDKMGPIQWELALTLFFVWVIVFLSLCKGIRSSGKVSLPENHLCLRNHASPMAIIC